MIHITDRVALADNEIELQFIRAQGAGGQNVNKVSTAVHLRFDIAPSSLPKECQQRLLSLKDRRISGDGVIVIKSQQFRSQEKNRDVAIQRLVEIIRRALIKPKLRKATKPTKTSQIKRLDSKTRQGQKKSLRAKIHE